MEGAGGGLQRRAGEAGSSPEMEMLVEPAMETVDDAEMKAVA